MIQITKMAGVRSWLKGDESAKKSLNGWLFKIMVMLFFFISSHPLTMAQYQIKYIGANPASGATVNSFDNIELEFDLSEVVDGLGGEGEWGISYNATYNAKLPAKEKSAALYKGSVEDGEVIARLSTRHSASEAGNKILLCFENIEIESGQEYNIVVTYEVFAVNVSDQSGSSETLALKDNPIVLTYYGGNETQKVLTLISNSVEENINYEKIPELKVTFNYDVTVNNDFKVTVFEGNNEIVTSSTVEADPEDGKSIIVKFPETPIYLGRSYNIVIPAGAVSIADEEDTANPEITIPVKGGSYLYFSVGRGLIPSDGSVSILDEITIPFKFPASDTKTYGLKDSGVPMTVYVYDGDNTEGEELLSVEGNASTDGTSLVIMPNYAFESGSQYTFVIPEGSIEVYDLGARNPTIQKELKNERIILRYTTPTVESLPAWTPSPLYLKNNDELPELKYYIIDSPDYEYDDITYSTIVVDKYDISEKGALYLVTENGDELIKTFRITKKTLDSESEIVNDEVLFLY